VSSETEKSEIDVLSQLPSIDDVEEQISSVKRELATLELLLASLQIMNKPQAKQVSTKQPLKEFRFQGDDRVFKLKYRIIKAFRRNGIRSIDELVQKTAEDLLAIQNFGYVSLHELQDEMAKHGLKLRTQLLGEKVLTSHD
jgi:DNA-directed RNA polymerase alpha subunit